MSYRVSVEQGGRTKDIPAQSGDNLLRLLHENGYDLNAYCGGAGVCGKCRVRLRSDGPDPTVDDTRVFTQQELDAGLRLACGVTIVQDLCVSVDDQADITVLTDGLETDSRFNPHVRKAVLRLRPPTLEDQSDFLSRVSDSLTTPIQSASVAALRQLSQVDKNQAVTVTVWGDRLIRVEGGDTAQSLYGVAIDIGTTTVAMYLMNLASGKQLSVYSLYNPQRRFGADVVSRVNYTLHNDHGLQELQAEIVDGLNAGLQELMTGNGLQTDEIMAVSIVGNTLMLHALLGISGASITRSPYIPVFTDKLACSPKEIGLTMNQEGVVQLLPSISGYVGADIVGDLLAVVLPEDPETLDLMVDIGTNGEMVLGNQHRMLACSTAAGPAFEGANITFGMAGVSGAISEFAFDAGQVHYQTIGQQKPRGICGSGIVDVIAGLVKNGFLEPTGSFLPETDMTSWQRQWMTEYQGMRAFRLVLAEETTDGQEICLTQKDVREFQLAKGALAAGIRVLLKEAGVELKQIGQVYVAGGFGNYVDPHNACVIGILPQELEERIVRIGNGAGTGAKKYLLDRNLIAVIEDFRRKIRYIELSSRLDFQTEFVEAMMF